MEPNYILGMICLVYLGYVLYILYKNDQTLKVPNYVIFYGLFALYALLCNMFVSEELQENGIVKYLYSDPFIQTFIAFLVVENVSFPSKWMDWALKIFGLTLVIAAIVSIIQTFKPLFLVKTDDLVQGLSYGRMQEYYSNNPQEVTGDVNRFIDGYRHSIFSFINEVSVGVDAMALFSIMIAVKSKKWIKTVLIFASATTVGFLSSARWIMLNFLVISSQKIWIGKNKLVKALKFGLYGLVLLTFIMVAISFSGINLEKFIEERLLSDSAGTRLLAFEVFFKVFPHNPILGTMGLDTEEVVRLLRGRSSQIHVGYLKLFYYYGLVGGLIYLTFLGLLLKRMIGIGRSSGYWGGFFAFLAFAVANLTLVIFDLFYYGLMFAIIFSNYYNQNRGQNISLKAQNNSTRSRIDYE
ncbi:O-antigen ligase family protein [Zobellia roscoffensis]|uniref:O-antigen ligase family protein n=1 Tax=Zobellia roscoffensis TaxID=2779508 RepID=UPI001D04C70C|nr:O-antigen ligase family protein [Zobellia roscoffensis]